MKSRIVAISDIHFNLQNIGPATSTLAQALKEARARKADLFIGGDLNDQKAILRAECVDAIIKLMDEYKDVCVYVLIGNHDLVNHNSKEHSLGFMALLPNVSIIQAPVKMGKWFCIPYVHRADIFKEHLKVAEESGAEYLLIHQGIRGAQMSSCMVDSDSIEASDFAKFKMVFSGHYHLNQIVGGNIIYWGSPFSTTFDEADQMKFIHYLDVGGDEMSYETMITDARKHIQIEFEGVVPDVIRPVRPIDLVKVVLRGDKNFIASVDKQKLKSQLGVENLVVVPIITKASSVRLMANAASKPMEIMMKFLESTDTTLDKAKLNDYIKAVV